MAQGHALPGPGAEVKIKKIRKDTQDHKQDIKDNITEIFCIRANYEVYEDRIGRLERVVRNQEKALISQEKKLEEIEEESKKREEEIQAQNRRVDVWDWSSYQELPAQSTTEALQNLNQPLESQKEQEFKESPPVHLGHLSKHRAALVKEEASLPSPSGAFPAALLDSISISTRKLRIPTVESTPRVRESSRG